MSTMNIYDMTDAWDAAGTTFTAIKMDVTDTDSDPASLLMDLLVDGVSQFQVSKIGEITVPPAPSVSSYSIKMADPDGTVRGGIAIGGFGNFLYDGTTAITRWLSGRGLTLPSGLSFTWSGGGAGSSPDLFLSRDAANTLAQRNSTNAQTFNIYNTFTDASNYERGGFKWDSNSLLVGTEQAGTGSIRDLKLMRGGAVVVTLRSTDIALSDDVVVAGHLRMNEVTAPSSPAANNGILYFEDNGSGKTRLMALFPTGAAQQIAIEP